MRGLDTGDALAQGADADEEADPKHDTTTAEAVKKEKPTEASDQHSVRGCPRRDAKTEAKKQMSRQRRAQDAANRREANLERRPKNPSANEFM